MWHQFRGPKCNAWCPWTQYLQNLDMVWLTHEYDENMFLIVFNVWLIPRLRRQHVIKLNQIKVFFDRIIKFWNYHKPSRLWSTSSIAVNDNKIIDIESKRDMARSNVLISCIILHFRNRKIIKLSRWSGDFHEDAFPFDAHIIFCYKHEK